MEEPGVDEVEDARLDGNAAAGPLAAVFGSDMTTVPGRCAHCGVVSVVAELRAYVRAPGTVLRCPACSNVVLRIVQTDEATYVDARGAAFMRFSRASTEG
jgi:hypothetical protein